LRFQLQFRKKHNTIKTLEFDDEELKVLDIDNMINYEYNIKPSTKIIDYSLIMDELDTDRKMSNVDSSLLSPPKHKLYNLLNKSENSDENSSPQKYPNRTTRMLPTFNSYRNNNEDLLISVNDSPLKLNRDRRSSIKSDMKLFSESPDKFLQRSSTHSDHFKFFPSNEELEREFSVVNPAFKKSWKLLNFNDIQETNNK